MNPINNLKIFQFLPYLYSAFFGMILLPMYLEDWFNLEIFSLVLFTISEAVSLVLRRPFVNFVTEFLIELMLIDDFSNEFLLALMSDIIPPH